jgi:hypothetical protein
MPSNTERNGKHQTTTLLVAKNSYNVAFTCFGCKGAKLFFVKTKNEKAKITNEHCP